MMSFKPRHARLTVEYEKLLRLAQRSRFIQVEPADAQPDSPPEKYIVTYTCKGIAAVDSDENPVSSDFHQALVFLGPDYPAREPSVKFLTPVWHPDIQREEPRGVSFNWSSSWYAAKGLADLVVYLGEMVQYKRYNAAWAPPYPLDRVVADWVTRVAEPRGIVGPDTPFDPRPLVEAVPPGEARRDDPPQPGKSRIKFGRRLE
jgi:ubiquitin-protein ligase